MASPKEIAANNANSQRSASTQYGAELTKTARRVNKSVGLQVRRLRKAQGMKTQRHLAFEAGLSVDCVGKIERGSTSPTVATLARIAGGLGVPVARLLDLYDEDSLEPAPCKEIVHYLRQKGPEDSASALAVIRQILDH